MPSHAWPPVEPSAAVNEHRPHASQAFAGNSSMFCDFYSIITVVPVVSVGVGPTAAALAAAGATAAVFMTGSV